MLYSRETRTTWVSHKNEIIIMMIIMAAISEYIRDDSGFSHIIFFIAVGYCEFKFVCTFIIFDDNDLEAYIYILNLGKMEYIYDGSDLKKLKFFYSQAALKRLIVKNSCMCRVIKII